MALMAGGKYPLRSYRYPGPREKVRTANKSKDSPAESQSRVGIGYRAGKSDTPLDIVVAELHFRFVANATQHEAFATFGCRDSLHHLSERRKESGR
jgi:hypothetical protein